MSCLDFDTAAAYLAGELDQTNADRCATHVAECTACRSVVRDASALIDEVRQDLLLLDEVIEDDAPVAVEHILERARNGAPTLHLARLDQLVAEPSHHDLLPSGRSRRPLRTLLGIAATAALALWISADTPSAAAARVHHAMLRIAAYVAAVFDARATVTAPPPIAISRPPAFAPLAGPPRRGPSFIKSADVTKATPPRRAANVVLDRLELAAWHQLHVSGLLLGNQAAVRRSGGSVVVSLAFGDTVRQAAVEAVFKRLPEGQRPVVEVISAAPDQQLPIVFPQSPLFERLRHHFLATPQARVVAEEFARSILMTSRRLHDRTASLRRFVQAFPVNRLRALDLDAAAEWRRVVRDHVMEIGAAAATIRQHLSMVQGTDPGEPSQAIETLSEVDPALVVYLRLSDEAISALHRAIAPGESTSALETLVGELERLVSDAEAFAGPWDLSR